jgi:hypothetical protein
MESNRWMRLHPQVNGIGEYYCRYRYILCFVHVVQYFVSIFGFLGTDHLTCRGEGGYGFCFVQNFIFGQHESWNIFFSPELTLGYMTKTLEVKWSVPYLFGMSMPTTFNTGVHSALKMLLSFMFLYRNQ